VKSVKTEDFLNGLAANFFRRKRSEGYHWTTSLRFKASLHNVVILDQQVQLKFVTASIVTS
jgi:hypothetical protein